MPIGRLETIASWLAARATALAAVVLIAASAVIAADYYLGLGRGLSPRWLQSIGKGLGDVSGNLALLSLAYYLGRVLYTAVQRGAILGSASAAPLKYVLRLLRLTHPLVGALAAAAAAFHGYLLWSGRLPVDEITGLAALTMLVFLSVSGLLLATVSGPGLRAGHRYAGLAFILLYALHKLAAD